MTTFYTQPVSRDFSYRDAPRLMVVSWDHEKERYADGHALLDIKPLLKLRAYSTSSTIKFVCRRLVEFDAGHRECWNCEQCITCDNIDYDSDAGSLYDYDCSHEDTLDEIFYELDREYAYLRPLNEFLANNNKAWLEAVRADFKHAIAVHCTMGQSSKVPTIYIQFGRNDAPPQLRMKRMYSSAAEYLTQMGIMDLDLRAKLDFVVGVATGKYMRPSIGASSAVATHHQTFICGRTYKAPFAASRGTVSPSVP